MTKKTSEIITGLLDNGRDSIRHAMGHFSNRNENNGESKHDDKWIVLSVHHAAECICNALLLQVEPDCPIFERNGSVWFPSLTKSIDRLRTLPNIDLLKPPENKLLSLLEQLPEIRHKFMHRVAPEKVDVSVAAMSLIGILKHLELRYETSSCEIICKSPPIEVDIVSSIRYQRLEEYGNFIQAFLNEKYEEYRLEQCPACGVQSVIGSVCEACFEALDSINCPECDTVVLFPEWEKNINGSVATCQDCGTEIVIYRA